MQHRQDGKTNSKVGEMFATHLTETGLTWKSLKHSYMVIFFLFKERGTESEKDRETKNQIEKKMGKGKHRQT